MIIGWHGRLMIINFAPNCWCPMYTGLVGFVLFRHHKSGKLHYQICNTISMMAIASIYYIN